jgi:hypothetical protein
MEEIGADGGNEKTNAVMLSLRSISDFLPGILSMAVTSATLVRKGRDQRFFAGSE